MESIELQKEIDWANKRLDEMYKDRSYLGNAPSKLRAYLAGLKKAKSIIENTKSEEIGWILNA